ncbi:hypothetical protein V6N13_099670 [Hibiscus sabdariffa]
MFSTQPPSDLNLNLLCSTNSALFFKTQVSGTIGLQEVEDEALNAVCFGKEYNFEKSLDTLDVNRRLGESELLGVESYKARGHHTDINLEGAKSSEKVNLFNEGENDICLEQRVSNSQNLGVPKPLVSKSSGSSKPSWVEVVCKLVAFGHNRETAELDEMAQNSVSDSVRNDGSYLGLGRHKTDLVESVSDMEQEILFGPYETHGRKERRKRDRALKRAKIKGCGEEGSELEGRLISDADIQARRNTLLLEAEKNPSS